MNDLGAGCAAVDRRRRLTDKILLAFNQACDVDDLEVATSLLKVLDGFVGRPFVVMPDRRKDMFTTVAAHERLWLLKHPDKRF